MSDCSTTETDRDEWRRVWRDGFAPVFSVEQLAALADGLRHDDPGLCHGDTVLPWTGNLDRKPERACAVAYAGWAAHDFQTVEQVNDFFAVVLTAARWTLGKGDDEAGAAVASKFLNFWDDGRPEVVRPALLEEVERELARRAAVAEAPAF